MFRGPGGFGIRIVSKHMDCGCFFLELLFSGYNRDCIGDNGSHGIFLFLPNGPPDDFIDARWGR